MPSANERRGIIASEGIFTGRIVRLDDGAVSARTAGTAEQEAAALAEAMAAATQEIATLMDRIAGDAGDILGFQLALLEDDELVAPARTSIAAGTAADRAWAQALDDEIAGYDAAEDEYFKARASDLRDLRDRVLRHLTGGAESLAGPAGVVLVGDDIAPSRFLEADWSQGGAILLARGSTTAHVAMLARSWGVPMLVGLGDIPAAREAIVDALGGVAIFDPSDAAKSAFEHRAKDLAETRKAEAEARFNSARLQDGTRIEVLVNIASPQELDAIDSESCDGIGLMRSEFLFADGGPLPDEETQYRAYKRLLDWAGDKPVTIRTLDIGGDKPITGLTQPGEQNPFLGLRGVRLALAHKDVFNTQFRALARAAVHGHLKVMIPMVTVPEELIEAAAMLDACVTDLASEGVPAARPPLGIMVEVPAVAICPELFDKAAFFSIGSNDLTQYVTAASRDDPAVASLNDPSNPAVLKLIEGIARFGQAAGIDVSLCGDMASESAHLAALIKAGLRTLSVAPSRIGRVKLTLGEL